MTSITKIPQTMAGHVREACASLRLKTRIEVEEDGTVRVDGDAIEEQRVLLMVKALGRGFEKDEALLLLNDDYDLRVINLKDYFGSKSHFQRIKARVIGRRGSIKKSIEGATLSRISISGNHISIIAPYYSLPCAEEAVSMLIKGSKHSTLANYLARKRKELFYAQLKGERNV